MDGGAPNLIALDLLDGTLFDRRLSMTSEEIVGALVGVVFEGIRDYVIQVLSPRPPGRTCAMCNIPMSCVRMCA